MSTYAVLLVLSLGVVASAEQAGGIITIPLNKQYAPVIRDNKTVAYKTAYFGRVFIGSQAESFTAVFDTGSGHFFVPSVKCKDEACNSHRKYDQRTSTFAVDINHDGAAVAVDSSERDQVSISFGTGDVTGEFIHDVVCLKDHHNDTMAPDNRDCITTRIILATEMSTEPFRSFEFDGVLGLGLESLALHPEFSFFGQMVRAKQLDASRFGVFLSMSDNAPSEISFGGEDVRRMADNLMWSSVAKPELGYWQVRIRSVTIDGEALPLCETGSCVGIVDSGSSLLGVPKQGISKLHWLLARKVPGDPSELDCREFPGPTVVIDVGGFLISLGPEDYSRPAAMRVKDNKRDVTQVLCRASLLPVDFGASSSTWILGEPVLRKYYTVYDWEQKRIGFARARQPLAGVDLIDGAAAGSEQPPTQHAVIGAPSSEKPAPTMVMV